MFKRYRNPLEKEITATSSEVGVSATTIPSKLTPSPTRNSETGQTFTQPIPPRLYHQDKVAVPSLQPSSAVADTAARKNTTTQTPQLEGEEPDTTLGEGVVFKGELTFKRLLRIDGQFEGELVSEGKLIVGKTGTVKSNIRMQEAIIEGRVEGNITVSGRLELRREAQVIGDIKASLFSVDEGVSILGHVAVTPDSNASPPTP